MENTLENKRKFFAMYWGQKVADYEKFKNPIVCKRTAIEDCNRGYYLDLKPLSSITDEESGIISTIIGRGVEDESSKTWVIRFFSGFIGHTPICRGELDSYSRCIDYLRSRGYAMPWMGLSVEMLVEYGWVKLVCEDATRIDQRNVFTGDQLNKIPLGLYKIYWKTGGSSLASVGNLHDGVRWIAPINWTSAKDSPTGRMDEHADSIERMVQLDID